MAPVQMTAAVPIPGTFTGLAAARTWSRHGGVGSGKGAGIGPGTGGRFGGGAMRPGNGVTNPTILKQVDPKYARRHARQSPGCG